MKRFLSATLALSAARSLEAESQRVPGGEQADHRVRGNRASAEATVQGLRAVKHAGLIAREADRSQAIQELQACGIVRRLINERQAAEGVSRG